MPLEPLESTLVLTFRETFFCLLTLLLVGLYHLNQPPLRVKTGHSVAPEPEDPEPTETAFTVRRSLCTQRRTLT